MGQEDPRLEHRDGRERNGKVGADGCKETRGKDKERGEGGTDDIPHAPALALDVLMEEKWLRSIRLGNWLQTDEKEEGVNHEDPNMNKHKTPRADKEMVDMRGGKEILDAKKRGPVKGAQCYQVIPAAQHEPPPRW
ncbi:Aste57867_11099 [Aphanomyces stellatus]|uniref:Aste57867_11099 protein n=1 Tax=Aphanomyces stellatus TaxID=120398 RepID=A0A485KSG6_9STRA|nr:hypothetical protein As57867_011057 [Aphanomyces stellatus]VFT87966.1 Aste57867_11099 [Aphanomyces stellatus]